MLNLYDILYQILNEDVQPSNVIDAIKNRCQVIITYSDEKDRAPKKRLIEPYVYGLSKAGNSVFRAYQYEGDTFRGVPKWKLFRLDRVTSWQPTDSHFTAEPKERGWNAESYNENGDNSMSTVLTQVDLSNSDNPYEKSSDLHKLRNKTSQLKQSSPINISQMKNSDYGPVKNKSVADFNTPEFKEMLRRNLDITNKERERKGLSLSKNGPVSNVNVDNNVKADSEPQNAVNSDDFKKMLDKNLEITRKEKEKRGFDINKTNGQ